MRAGQLEVEAIMVKLPESPAIGIMATGAVLPHSPLVNVVRTMTGGATLAGILVSRRRMAGLARRACMHPQKREGSHVMIEAHLVLPLRFAMTGGAIRSQLGLVGIVTPVTADTGGLQLDLFGILFMAIVAVQLAVGAAQRKFGVFVMIELDRLP